MSDTDSQADLQEVAMISDVLVSEEFILGPDDAPPPDDDDDDDGDEAIEEEAGGQDMDMQPSAPALDPPAEDHSVMQLRAHTGPVFAVGVNAARPTTFATGGGDDAAYLWRTSDAAPLRRLEGHTDTIGTLAFSSDGTLLATGGLDGTVRVWNAETGDAVVTLEGPTQGVNWLCWHARGAVLLAGSEDATAWMWKLPEGSVMQIFSAHSASISYGGFVNSGKNVLTASEDGTVRVWNPRAGTVEHCFHAGTQADPLIVTCLAAHAAQPTCIFGAEDGSLKLAQVESGRIVSELAAHDASVESAAFCDCMPLAASAAMDNRLCVWDLGSYTLRHTCVHPAGVVELRWRRDSPLLVSCAVSRELRLWDARNGACLNVLTGHCDAVLCIDLGYTEHGMYVVSGADDHSARLWALDV